MKARDLFELVRLPNVFTAPADVAMGLAVSGAPITPRACLLFGASACAYAGGMALNDACDAALDAEERPGRPIPSGRVSRRAAFQLAAGLLAAALALAAAVSLRALAAAGGLVAAIVLYDTVARRTTLGPAVMASCRALDAGLGLALGALAWQSIVPVVLLVLWVMTITTVSQFETAAAPRRIVRSAAGDFAVAIAGAGWVIWRSDPPSLAAGWALLGALALWLLMPMRAALADPSPKRIVAVIKASVLGIIFLDAAFVAAALGWPAGLAVAALFAPAYHLGRRFGSA